jgi:orotidine-5'-phosphate decarboxylase
LSSARDRIAWAADVPISEALILYPRIQKHIGVVKVGLSLFVEHGPAAVKRFQDEGARVFLDLKLHDIPNTVELAAEKAGALGVAFLTVHAHGGPAMIRAAVAGAKRGADLVGKEPPVILAVTVLTALSAQDVLAVGHAQTPEALARQLGSLAIQSGAGGLVCSPHEAAALKSELGRQVFLCTPGIRPLGAAVGDQARAETPSFAMKAGADLLVVGRPIHTAENPVDVAQALETEIETSLASIS